MTKEHSSDSDAKLRVVRGHDPAAIEPVAYDPVAFNTVTFMSDLGSASEHVGVVKATLRELAPDVAVVDLVHDLAPFDVRGASLALARAVAYLNKGVIIVAVDPGAGGGRRLVAVEVGDGDGVFLGPDNGVLAPAVAIAGGAGRAVELDNVRFHMDAPGSTFAARDILAPVAAALCNGADLVDVGTPIEPDMLMPGVIPIHRVENGAVVCEVIWVDRFGNCQVNVSRDDLEDLWGAPVERVRLTLSNQIPGIGDRAGDTVRNVRIVGSFAALGAPSHDPGIHDPGIHDPGIRVSGSRGPVSRGPGSLGLVVDSAGLLCLAVDRGSASAELGVAEGDQVVISAAGDGDARDTTGTTVRVAPPTARKQ